MELIGAKTYTTTYGPTYTYHYCDCFDNNGPKLGTNGHPDLRAKYNVPEPTRQPNVNCPPGCDDVSVTVTPSVTTTNIYDSDGVVLANSAAEYPGYSKKVIMQDSNHKSMKNDDNTKNRLIELFNGNHGNYFKTDPR